MFFFELGNARLQGGGESTRQGYDPMFASLSTVDMNRSVPEVEILDAEPEDFDLPQSGSVGHLCHEFPGVAELADDPGDFFAGENGGWLSLSGPSGVKVELGIRLPIDMSRQENDRVEGLFLGGNGAGSLQRDKAEVSACGIGGEFVEAFPKTSKPKVAELLNPPEVGSFRRCGMACQPNLFASLFHECSHDFFFPFDRNFVAGGTLRSRSAPVLDGNGIPQARGMGIFERGNLIGDGPPVEFGRPWLMGYSLTPEANGKGGLSELPITHRSIGGESFKVSSGLGP